MEGSGAQKFLWVLKSDTKDLECEKKSSEARALKAEGCGNGEKWGAISLTPIYIEQNE